MMGLLSSEEIKSTGEVLGRLLMSRAHCVTRGLWAAAHATGQGLLDLGDQPRRGAGARLPNLRVLEVGARGHISSRYPLISLGMD